MCVLLVDIMDAHGGLERWCDVRSIDIELTVDGFVIPTLRRVVRRTPDGPLISGRTSFILDYVDVGDRQ